MKPPRSKTTLLTFLALARSATVLPTLIAVATLARVDFLASQVLLRGIGRGEGLAGFVVDHLGVDVLAREMHRETRALGRAGDFLAQALWRILSGFELSS